MIEARLERSRSDSLTRLDGNLQSAVRSRVCCPLADGAGEQKSAQSLISRTARLAEGNLASLHWVLANARDVFIDHRFEIASGSPPGIYIFGILEPWRRCGPAICRCRSLPMTQPRSQSPGAFLPLQFMLVSLVLARATNTADEGNSLPFSVRRTFFRH